MTHLAPPLLYPPNPNIAEDRCADNVAVAQRTAQLLRAALETFRATVDAILCHGHAICPMGSAEDVAGSLADFEPYGDEEIERLVTERFWDRESE